MPLKPKNQKLPDSFANHFQRKVNDLVSNAMIDPTIYNGKKKLNGSSTMFMNKEAIVECLKSIKIKNTEGFDRIPQRILVDGSEHLVDPLTELFGLIYNHNQLPEQWLIAKTIPLHKKGSKQDIENYRPIANLCSCTKIFEKLILKRILTH